MADLVETGTAKAYTNGVFNSLEAQKNYKFKLIYFEDRGRADLIKLLFSIVNCPYEDVKISPIDWNHYKTFMPFEQLPVLIINNETKIAQATTICRFLANQFKLNGTNELDNIMCDMVVEQLRECGDDATHVMQEMDLNKKQILKNRFIETLRKTLKGYENLLSMNRNKYIVSNNLTWADLALVNGWEWLDDISKQMLNYYPLVKSHNEFIRNIPQVNEWFKSQKPLRVLKYA
jgi:glutathione S-transferase